MIPRFSNPHFLPQIATPATRAQLYAVEDAQGEEIDNTEVASTIARLTEILSQNFPVLTDERPSRKRRKVMNDQEYKHEIEQDQDQPVCMWYHFISNECFFFKEFWYPQCSVFYRLHYLHYLCLSFRRHRHLPCNELCCVVRS